MDGSRKAPLTRTLDRLRHDLQTILRGALDAIDPARLVAAGCRRAVLPLSAPVIVVAAGKAAYPMARAVTTLVEVRRGVLATPRADDDGELDGFEWYNAAHPLPDTQSERAGRAALALASAMLGESMVVLLSGGASAMLAVPARGLTIDDKRAATAALLRGGVAIEGMNCVRRHLSAVKGGHLGAAARHTITLAISDVHGPVADDPAAIGSGPTAPDATTFADALSIARTVSGMPQGAIDYLERGVRGDKPETIKPGDARLANARYEVLANRHTAVAGARASAESAGYGVRVIANATHGEARLASARFLAEARALAAEGPRPLCILASGETTVRVTGGGLGGRNQEFALAAAPHVARFGRAALVASVGTDGVDGPTDAAGAVVDSATVARADRAGLDWNVLLRANDAYRFFEPLGDLITWGPTRTNVGDLHVMLVA